MRRISLGSFLLVVAFGLAAGCASTTTSRFNLFNHNKAKNDGCVEVGAGPICEGPIMGGGMDRLPAESSFMLPGDGSLMPGTMMPGAGSGVVGPTIQGSGSINNIMPPASPQSSGQPPRLIPTPPGKPMPYTGQQ